MMIRLIILLFVIVVVLAINLPAVADEPPLWSPYEKCETWLKPWNSTEYYRCVAEEEAKNPLPTPSWAPLPHVEGLETMPLETSTPLEPTEDLTSYKAFDQWFYERELKSEHQVGRYTVLR